MQYGQDGDGHHILDLRRVFLSSAAKHLFVDAIAAGRAHLGLRAPVEGPPAPQGSPLARYFAEGRYRGMYLGRAQKSPVFSKPIVR